MTQKPSFKETFAFLKRILILFIFLILSCNELTAKTEIPITRTNIPPKIDGIIDDDAWKNRMLVPEFESYNGLLGLIFNCWE